MKYRITKDEKGFRALVGKQSRFGVAFKAHRIASLSRCRSNVNHCILLMYDGKEYEIMQPIYAVAMYIKRHKN